MTDGSTDYDDGFVASKASPMVGGVAFRLNERSVMQEAHGGSKDPLLMDSIDQSLSMVSAFKASDKMSRQPVNISTEKVLQ